MKITDIISTLEKPLMYEKGSAFMWTDEHISKQLLNIHLNPDIDLGSRKMSTINKTANWILDTHPSKNKINILDLGCGPGLYSDIFAKKGHQVTGVDISKTSIEYAKKSASEKKLDIEYIQTSYLDLELEPEKYDLVILVYTDMGVLLPAERQKLISFVHKSLKKGGLFIFDVLKDNNIENKTSPNTWEVAKKGFWKDTPYLALSNSYLYKEQKIILFQHLVIDSNENKEVYRFWTHFFSENDLTKMLNPHSFTEIKFRDNILPKSDMWNGDNVIFSITQK